MYRTPRYWGLIGLTACFAVLSLVFNGVIFAVCAGGLLAWGVIAEGRFRERSAIAATTVGCSYEISTREVGADQPLRVTTTVTAPPLPFGLEVDQNYPIAATGAPTAPQIDIESGESERQVQAELRIPFAGTYEFGPATATVTSAYGLFETAVPISEPKSVTVEPQRVPDMHVGQGGQEFAVTFGEHGADTTGPGMDPSGTRTYQPGDPASRINWKATARLDDVYVDEFEVEITRPLLVFLDTREPTDTAATDDIVEYRRHIAAALVAEAAASGDPVALYRVTDTGVEASPRVSASPQQYATVRDQLYRTQQGDGMGGHCPASGRPVAVETRLLAERLGDDNSAFNRKIAPFVAEGTTRLRHTTDDPLTQTVATYLNAGGQSVRVALIAGDAYRSELYEAARVAGQRSPEVLAFITPTVLFESQPLGNIENAYGRYSDFERYRQQLDHIDNVTAFEVAPSDALDTIVETTATDRSVMNQ